MSADREQPFQCTYRSCGALFSQPQNVKDHVDYTHLGIRYICADCSYLAGSKSTYFRHKRTKGECKYDEGSPPYLVVFKGDEPKPRNKGDSVFLKGHHPSLWKRHQSTSPNVGPLRWLEQSVTARPVQIKPVAGTSGVAQAKMQKAKRKYEDFKKNEENTPTKKKTETQRLPKSGNESKKPKLSPNIEGYYCLCLL